MTRFSAIDNANFDMVIIGGGITGACLAYEASTKDLKVALFEKSDFGGATSAATSKLIHGGLRYLKNFEIGLVRESLRERRILENIAPNFVYPLPFMVPTYKSFKNNKWILYIGMLLYDFLSFDKKFTWDKSKKLPGFKSYSRKKTIKREPCIKQHHLTGSMIYYDCQSIFPERMTLAFIKSAEKKGAYLANYTRVEALIYNGKRVDGVVVKDLIDNQEKKIKARVVVNCAGPWADILLNKISKHQTNHHIQRSEGIHLLTRKICHNHAVTVFTKDEKHVMVMPWRNHSLIGTTDKEYKGDPDDYQISKESINELLNAVNENYDNAQLSYEDVLFAYGGLRPLAEGQSNDSYKASRKYEVFDNADEGLDGMITVEGGKYTTSRNLAAEVMKIIDKKLNRKHTKSLTDSEYLAGCEIEDISLFMDQLKSKYADFQENTIDYLGKNYGTECHAIFKLARENKDLAEVLNNEGEIMAEVVYAIENEMAYHLSDILFRRTGLGTLGHPGKEILEKVCKVAAHLLNWDKDQIMSEMNCVQDILNLP